MAGGNFDINTPKVRPGNYFNFKAQKKNTVSTSSRGTVIIPLVGYDWGPTEEFIKLTSDAPEAEIAKLGRSIYSGNDLTQLIRLAFENASTVYVYIIGGGTEAKAVIDTLTVTALYGGTRGNDIKVTSVANAISGYDVGVYVGADLMEFYEEISTVEELAAKNSEYVTFSGTGDLTAFAAVSLEGGTDGVATNADFTTFLDRVERVKSNTVLIPVSDEALMDAAASKVKYLRTKVGKTVQFVFANYEGDDIGIINVVNSFHLYEVDLSVIQAAAWFAGATAGADKITSNTYKQVANATAVVGEFSNEEAEQAIKNGKLFFSVDDEGNVIVEYDINSLVHPNDDQDEYYKKNRVIRVYDSFQDDVSTAIPPAKYNNDSTGWGLMEGLGKALLKNYETAGAIKNVDYDNDFLVDKTRSVGDATYFNIALQAVDSSEKHYFTISTQ